MTPRFQSININNTVRVRLNDKGREIYMQTLERLGIESGPPKEDADGWCEMPLWELMQYFGPHLYNGCAVPFETTVQIDTNLLV